MSSTPTAAPVDPRVDLPAFGSLPPMASIDEVIQRVIAPNPSPLTLDGTNTYLVGEPGSGDVVIVDPGPDNPEHLARVRVAVLGRSAAVAGVLVTHHHTDHSEAAVAWGEYFKAPVLAPAAAKGGVSVVGPSATILRDGDVVGPAGARLEVIATPGHCADHLAFRASTGAILVGDHVLGRGTSVVAHPDGDLLAYLDSLAKVHALGPDVLCPGHGPALTQDVSEILTYYAAHRAHRERQVIEVLERGPAAPRQIVEVIYAAYDPSVWMAAESSTRACLAKLRGEGRIDWDEGNRTEVARLVQGRDQTAETDADSS